MDGNKRKSGGGGTPDRRGALPRFNPNDPGWYKDEKGRWCYKGKCVDMRIEPDDGIEINLRNSCGLNEKETEREFLEHLTKAAGRGTRINYKDEKQDKSDD